MAAVAHAWWSAGPSSSCITHEPSSLHTPKGNAYSPRKDTLRKTILLQSSQCTASVIPILCGMHVLAHRRSAVTSDMIEKAIPHERYAKLSPALYGFAREQPPAMPAEGSPGAQKCQQVSLMHACADSPVLPANRAWAAVWATELPGRRAVAGRSLERAAAGRALPAGLARIRRRAACRPGRASLAGRSAAAAR